MDVEEKYQPETCDMLSWALDLFHVITEIISKSHFWKH